MKEGTSMELKRRKLMYRLLFEDLRLTDIIENALAVQALASSFYHGHSSHPIFLTTPISCKDQNTVPKNKILIGAVSYRFHGTMK